MWCKPRSIWRQQHNLAAVTNDESWTGALALLGVATSADAAAAMCAFEWDKLHNACMRKIMYLHDDAAKCFLIIALQPYNQATTTRMGKAPLRGKHDPHKPTVDQNSGRHMYRHMVPSSLCILIGLACTFACTLACMLAGMLACMLALHACWHTGIAHIWASPSLERPHGHQ